MIEIFAKYFVHRSVYVKALQVQLLLILCSKNRFVILCCFFLVRVRLSAHSLSLSMGRYLDASHSSVQKSTNHKMTDKVPSITSKNMSSADKALYLQLMREKASNCLQELQDTTAREIQSKTPDGSTDATNGNAATTEIHETQEFQLQFFNEYGFLVLRKFADMETMVQPMKEQTKQWVDTLWDVKFEDDDDEGKAGTSSGTNSNVAVFRTDEGQTKAQGSNAYFLESATKIHFFAEKEAMSGTNGRLKREFRANKTGALNKTGHAMHLPSADSNVFHRYSSSEGIRALVMDTLGYVDPVIPQSMYIFKQPFVGSEVTSHQDSTFLFTTPEQTCLGLWLALDEVTVENGCLWVRPGSQTEAVRRRFVRNPEYFGDTFRGVEGDKTKSLMIFEMLADEHELKGTSTWEGSLPEGSLSLPCDGLFDAGFIPVECKAGDLVTISGQLDHLSLPNHSSMQRHTFQLHLVEGPDAGITWAASNWLQYPNGTPFLSIKGQR